MDNYQVVYCPMYGFLFEDEEDKYQYAVVDLEGRIVHIADSPEEADEYIAKEGRDEGWSVYAKKKPMKQKVGDKIERVEVVRFGRFSSPGKMPCRSLGYRAGGKFTCPVGYKLAKVPGTVCYFCYGAGGQYIMPNVKLAQDRRYKMLKFAMKRTDRQEKWITSLAKVIGRFRVPYFRWHDTGDLQNELHLNMIMDVIRRTPKIHHWIPTKELALVRGWLDEWGEKAYPTNLNIRVSAPRIGQRLKVRKPLTTSSVSDPEGKNTVADPVYPCPATWQHDRTEGKCGKCRGCWTRSVANVDYLLHVPTQMSRARKQYLGRESTAPADRRFLSEGDVVCAWCGKHLRDDPKISGTSHGMCPECTKKMDAEISAMSNRKADIRITKRPSEPPQMESVNEKLVDARYVDGRKGAGS